MHKLKLKHFLLAASLSLGAQVSHAATLGALTVLSGIGQPLNAEIEIIPASEQELASLSAKLAADTEFSDQGLKLSPELSAIHIEVGARPDGKPVLWLSSVEAISSPSLDLLIDVSWDSGSLVRKYAVALEVAPVEEAQPDVALPDLTAPIPENQDSEALAEEEITPEELPEFTDEMAELEALPGLEEEEPYREMTPDEIAVDRQAIEEETAEDFGALDQPIPEDGEMVATTDEPQALAEEIAQPEPAQAAVAQEAGTMMPAVSSAVPMADYTVENGDTLRNISVQKGVDGVSLEQMMAGLYRANPHAFAKGNINRLKTGEILHAPSPEELKAIDQLDAERTVHMHAKNWNGYRNKLAEKVAKSAPVKDDQPASQMVSGKIDSVKDQAAATGPRDVVKLSGGDAEKSGKGNQSKAALEEELIARDKALQESNERIAMLEKQLQDAQKLLELRKQSAVGEVAKTNKPGAAAEKAKPAKPVLDQIGLTTLQEQLQRHPAWAPTGGVIAVLLLVLGLVWRASRKKKSPDEQPEVPVVAATESVADVIPTFLEETPVAVAEPLVTEPPAPPVAVLDMDDIAALMPEPEPEPVVEPEPEIVPEFVPAVAEPAMPVVEPEDMGSLADMLEMPLAAAAEPASPVEAVNTAPVAAEPDNSAFDIDDVFSNEAALAELVAATPAATEPEDATATAMADEAATDMMAMATGVEEEDPFALDDVFSAEMQQPAAEAVVEPVAEPPVAELEDPFALDDVFASEAALAELTAETSESPVHTPEDTAAETMVDEAATDMMAMAAGEVEAEDQFALDDVFAEAMETAVEPETEEAVVEVVSQPAAEPEPAAKTDDHSAALSAAFDESATSDLNDLDFGFDIDLGDSAAKAPTRSAAEKVPALDFSNINLNVGGGNASGAEAENAEPPEVDTKLDLVTAYIDMSDEDGARELLQEVLKEGGPNQIAKAQKMLDDLG